MARASTRRPLPAGMLAFHDTTSSSHCNKVLISREVRMVSPRRSLFDRSKSENLVMDKKLGDVVLESGSPLGAEQPPNRIRTDIMTKPREQGIPFPQCSN